MNAPKVGDRVRVEFEGVVVPGSIDEQDEVYVSADGGMPRGFVSVRPDLCTVIAPPVEVGDVINDVDVLRSLPMGSVVHGAGQNAVAQKVTPNSWYWANGYAETVRSEDIGLPAGVLHLGGHS